MAKKKQQEHNSGIGLAVAAVVAAAGVAFLYGTNEGKKTRKKIKGWSLKAKGEILEKLENAKDISDDSYHAIVDNVLAKYKKLKSVEDKEIDALLKEMKGHWSRIKKELKPVAAKTTPKPKTTTKKPVEKK